MALGAAAAVTSRIRLGTGICVALLYDPIILAKQVSTLDQLSGGRFVFGIGVGHGAHMRELERLCQAAGRPTAAVTAGLWKIDEPLMERCAEVGLDRCFVVFHAEDKESFPAFLRRASHLGRLLGGRG